jgi:hypothetical protein
MLLIQAKFVIEQSVPRKDAFKTLQRFVQGCPRGITTRTALSGSREPGLPVVTQKPGTRPRAKMLLED